MALAKDLLSTRKRVAPFSVRVQNDLGYDFVCPQLTACRRAIDLQRDWLLREAAAD